jgi:hypothetical protein
MFLLTSTLIDPTFVAGCPADEYVSGALHFANYRRITDESLFEQALPHLLRQERLYL